VARDQLAGAPHVAGGDCVLDRLPERVAVGEPGRRPAVQLGHPPRLRAGELVAEQPSEQVVEAVPLALGVQRHEEQTRPLELGQHRIRCGGLQERVAERAGHAIEHRGPQ
jgi:hypothetical protein